MAQHDYSLSNQSGLSFRQDLNNALSAIVSINSGATQPSTTYAYMLWADTTAGLLKQRNAANNAWVTLGTLGSANLGLLPSGGTLVAELGSASTPSHTFTGDLDTGLYSPGANQVALGTSGQQRLAVDSSGRVLVGPGTAREVGGAVIPTLAVESLGQAASFVRNSNDTSGGIVALGKSRGAAAGAITAVQNGDILGEIRFCGANGTDLTSIGAHIRAIVDGEVGTAGDTTDMPTSLSFSTTPDGAATATQRVVIDSSGNVEIKAQGDLRFADSDSSNWVAFQAPATVSSNVTWTLPATDGTNGQALKTNGSGTLTWGDAGAAVATRADVDGVHTTGTITSGTASLTVASAIGIVAGMVVTGEGIAPGTTVSSIASTTVTLSANAGSTLSSDPVGFYDNSKALSPGSVGGQLCRAWVNFDGTGTVAIRASYNVSSITDNGVGDYTVNFTTAMPDANYASVGTVRITANGSIILGGQTGSTTWQQPGGVRVQVLTTAGSLIDAEYANVAIFR